MSARGFTLIELLIATLVLLAISAAAAALTGPLHDAFERTISAGDLGTRSRAALEVLAADIRQAGTGLADVVPVVVPHASLETPETAAPFTALSVVLLPQHAGRAVLRAPVVIGAVTLQLEDAFACAGSDGSCGFAPGDAAAIFDATRVEPIAISDVVESDSRLVLPSALTTSFSSGALVVAVESTTYGTRADSAGIRLVRRTSGGAEQTLIDHVVRLEFTMLGVTGPPVPAAHEDGAPTYGPQPPRVIDDDARDSWPAGENCTLVMDRSGARVPRLARLDVADALVALDAGMFLDGPWCPDPGTASRFDADLLRLRAVGIAITVEVASAQLRGPASRLFGREGTGTRAAQWVPDLALQAIVTPTESPMKGMALVLTLLVLGACSALGAALVLVTLPERLAGGSYRDAVAALNAADAALELAARELGAIEDWNAVLAGTARSRLVDGPPSGLRPIARGDDIDLSVLTNQLTCDRPTICTDARVRVRTVERPWGGDNPRWQLFLYAPLATIASAPEFADRYVIVWIGDDSMEADGDPLVDGGAASGAGVVRARAESFGPGATRRAIEADLYRRDGIHVQSWRTLTPGVP